MKTLLATLLLATLCAASAFGQTIKSLGYNTTNFSIVYSGGQSLVWTSPVGVIFSNEITFRDSSGNNVSASGAGITFGSTNPNPIASVFAFEDEGANALKAIARTNLGLGLPALTNTDNVTTMRALAGSTNTNTPASGTYQLTNITSLTISNGIILEVEEP